jgi:uncharacterized membrane protein YoaK (UPF0700 family)
MIERVLFAVPLFSFLYGALWGTQFEDITQGDSLVCATIVWGVYMLKREP